MGLLDIFRGGGGRGKVNKLKPKVTQKYGDPHTRQKAIAQLGEMDAPEAVGVLLARFTITVDPLTTDADEKDQVFQLITGSGQAAVGPVKDFLARTDQASSWAVRILSSLLPETEVVGIATELLERMGAEYARNPEKKLVLLQFLEDKDDPRVVAAVLPFLQDMADDVKIAALKTLAPRKHESTREPILQLLTGEDTAKRVRTAAVAALHDAELGVQGYREKVEAQLTDPYFVDKSGLIKKRG